MKSGSASALCSSNKGFGCLSAPKTHPRYRLAFVQNTAIANRQEKSGVIHFRSCEICKTFSFPARLGRGAEESGVVEVEVSTWRRCSRTRLREWRLQSCGMPARCFDVEACALSGKERSATILAPRLISPVIDVMLRQGDDSVPR